MDYIARLSETTIIQLKNWIDATNVIFYKSILLSETKFLIL